MEKIFEADTCEICGASRLEHGVDDGRNGWDCGQCNAYNPNGSGKNAMPPYGWHEDERFGIDINPNPKYAFEPTFTYDYSKDEGKDIDPYIFMYLDTEVKKPDGLPKILSDIIDNLVDWYDKKMYRHFEIEVENLEGLVKNCHAMGEISDDQARTIFKMFGWVF